MKIRIEKPKDDKETFFEGTAKELLEQLEINAEEDLITRNGEIVKLEEELKDDDNIEILSVVSGG